MPERHTVRGLAAIPNRFLMGFRELMERFDPGFASWLLLVASGGAALEWMREIDPALVAREAKAIDAGRVNPDEIRRSAERARKHGMRQTAKLLDVIANELPKVDWAIRLPELQGRIAHELEDLMLMRIPADRAGYWDSPILLGEAAPRRFAVAKGDIVEAGSCLAAGRYTACVFHLMRVVEALMRVVASKLNIPDPTGGDRNWNNMLRAIDRAIAAKDSLQGNPATREPAWGDVRPIYKRTHSLLGIVKEAWRDETMHVDAKYDEADALRILHAVRGFVEHLAEKLP